MPTSLADIPVLVHIKGHSFWLHFLPPVVRARLCAENVRLTYNGHMPARGIELLMPDGRFWRLRVVEGAPTFRRFSVQEKFERYHLKWLGKLIESWMSWRVEWQRAFGRGDFERWDPVPNKRGMLTGGIGAAI